MYSAKSHISTFLILTCLQRISGLISELERIEFCRDLQCNETDEQKVCGVREINGERSYKLFDNECQLLKYGCLVDDDSAYGIINIKYCNDYNFPEKLKENCPTNCLSDVKDPVCAIRKDGEGFRIKIFKNQCELTKSNCEQDLKFNATDFFICDRTTITAIERRHSRDTLSDLLKATADEDYDVAKQSNYTQTNNSKIKTELTHGLKSSKNVSTREEINNLKTGTTESDDIKIYTLDGEEMRTTGDVTAAPKAKNKTIYKRIVVVRGSTSDMLNINRTVENFFGATHVWDLPIRENNMTERTRRMLVKVFGPLKVFTPWIKIPKVIKEDYYHRPTLSSCFHKCPMACPDTYAPVCGSPGTRAREPSIMFQNHCYMDVAQCKMYWEDKSWTATSSAYIESSFVFCLGNEMNGLFRFMPLIKTLQHMGRLKKRGRYKTKINNFRFFNNLLRNEPHLMG